MSNSSWSVPDSPSPPTSPEAEAEAEGEGEGEAEAEPLPNSPSSSPWSLGWYYIIETLADSKAHLPLLKELVNRLPNFYTDAPQSIQERLALRYLEECASTGRGIVDTKDNTAAATAIDISQPTLDFLCHNFKRYSKCTSYNRDEMSSSNSSATTTASVIGGFVIDPCQPSGSRIALVSNHIRQFISQKRSTLPKPSIQLLKESVSGPNAKLHSTRENGSSSSHRQKDNVVDEEQEMITSPRSGGTAGPMHNDASQSLSSQNALDADKTASEPLQENNPTTVIKNVSNLEAARSESLRDGMNKFNLKRRDAVSKTSAEEHKKPIPETSIPIEPSRNENDNNLRSNADFRDDASDCERFMGSPIPFSEQNQCIVCNKGGQLLTCSGKNCGITVHESCIMTTPSSFDKEGRFYCPCCVRCRAEQEYADAKKVFSLAWESLSSFLKMKKDENKEKGENGKQKVKKNITGKRKGKKAVFSDDDTAEDENGDAALLSSESDLRDSKRRVDKNGKRKEKRVKSNDRNVSKDSRDMLGGRGEKAKKREADLAFARLNKYIHVKSGPGATSGNYEAMPMNERRREDRINADAKNRKRCRPIPRYSNKVAGPHRRNMLPWSAEEENAIREGMKKIGVPADGRIPWSAILQLYRNAFHKTRFPNDLKDKWRNMMKKEERVDS